MELRHSVSLPLGLLTVSAQILLVVAIIWRIWFHLKSQASKSNRVYSHIVLLWANIIQIPFWITLTSHKLESLFLPGFSLLLISVPLLFVAVGLIIYQWLYALSATRNRCMPVYWLFLIHIGHLAASIYAFVNLWRSELNTKDLFRAIVQKEQYFFALHAIWTVDSLLTIISIVSVGFQLQCRLKISEMSVSMKRKSLAQISITIVFITTSLVIQLFMEFSFMLGIKKFWIGLNVLSICVLMFFIPSACITIIFMYLMRRVERCQRPTRLVVPPTPYPVTQINALTSNTPTSATTLSQCCSEDLNNDPEVDVSISTWNYSFTPGDSSLFSNDYFSLSNQSILKDNTSIIQRGDITGSSMRDRSFIV